MACLAEGVEANREAKRSQYDLKAQQEMAEWAYALLWVSIAGFLATIIGIALVALTWAATRHANKIADDTFKLSAENAKRQLRAYVLIYDVEVKPEGNPTPAQFRCNLEVKNFGQTPAHNVVVRRDTRIYDCPIPSDTVIPDLGDDILPTHPTIIGPSAGTIVGARSPLN